MSIFLRIPLGIIVAIIGFLMVLRTGVVIEWFGRVEWAEEKLGQGGTHTFWKLIGVAIVFVGIFISTDLMSGIIGEVAGIFVRSPR